MFERIEEHEHVVRADAQHHEHGEDLDVPQVRHPEKHAVQEDGHREARENLNMPSVAMNAEPVCAVMYTHTARIDAPAHDRSYPMIR